MLSLLLIWKASQLGLDLCQSTWCLLTGPRSKFSSCCLCFFPLWSLEKIPFCFWLWNRSYKHFVSITPHINHDWYMFSNLDHTFLTEVVCVLCTFSVLFLLATLPGYISKPTFTICPLGYSSFLFSVSSINHRTQGIYSPPSLLIFQLFFYCPFFSALRVIEHVTVLSHLFSHQSTCPHLQETFFLTSQ